MKPYEKITESIVGVKNETKQGWMIPHKMATYYTWMLETPTFDHEYTTLNAYAVFETIEEALTDLLEMSDVRDNIYHVIDINTIKSLFAENKQNVLAVRTTDSKEGYIRRMVLQKKA